MTEVTNPLNLRGIEFIEYASPDSDFMENAFYGCLLYTSPSPRD